MKTSKHTLAALLTASVCGIAVPHTGFAQSGTSGASAPSASAAGSQQRAERDMRASQLIGKEVRNAEGENLGEIHDLIVDVAAQRVHYAVLAFGGALGLGEKLFAYPMRTFIARPGSDELVLNVDKERLQNAPGFERNNWPDWGDSYQAEVDRYFQANAVGATPAGERMVRVSELIGKDVSDRNGADAGEVKDVVVNLGSNRVSYAVIDFDKAWSQDDKLIPLPMSALIFPARKDADIVLNLDRNQVNTARGFDEDQWPDLNNSAFRRDIQASFQRLQNPSRAQQNQGGATTSSGAPR